MSGDTGRSLVRPPPRTAATFLPVLRWLPRYRSRDLRADLVAGIAVAALLIPESMGYAGVAGVPPEVGLYAALGAVAAYALTGGTSILVVGPASAVAALSASIVAEVGRGADPVPFSVALALMSGLLLLVAGIARLGWIVNFISTPVLHAFVAGLAISIIVGQLDGLVGVEAHAESAAGRFVAVVGDVTDWHAPTVALGVGAVATMLVLEHVLPRLPAALLVVAAGVVLVSVLDLDSHGVAVVGDLPQGLPGVGVPALPLTAWLELLAGSAALLLVGFSEGYAAATTVADERGDDLDADQELCGAGCANLAAGLLGGLAVSGSLSKSAASAAAGARTQLANLAAGVLVLATLLFLGPLFARLPEPVLAAVVIVAVLRSADPRRFLAVRRVNPLDFVAGAATFALVLLWETLPALIVGVLLSLAFVVRRASFPDVVELHRDGSGRFVRETVPTAGPTPDGAAAGVGAPGRPEEPELAVVRIEAPLIYANTRRLQQAVRRLLRARPGLRVLVLDGEMVADLDSSGADALAEIDDALTAAGVELRLARVHSRARAQIERSDLHARFSGRIFPTVDAAAVPVDPGA